MDISGLRFVDMIDSLVIAKAKITYQGKEHLIKLTLLEPSKLVKVDNPDGSTTTTYNGKMIVAPVDPDENEEARNRDDDNRER